MTIRPNSVAQPRTPILNVMVQAAQKATRQLIRDFGEVEQLQVSVKSPSDFVSQADIKAEATIRAELAKARPDFAILAEETGSSGSDTWTQRWVIDPLDGTSNFLHGIPHWAISIGLEKRDAPDKPSEIVAGVIYNPAADELFTAEKGRGAFLNDRRLRVSGRRDLDSALFATGIPFAKLPRQAEFRAILAALQPRVAGIRRFGSASLDLAWVAAGRFDGFWELGLRPWDIAAGILMVREAGGFVTDAAGHDPMSSGDVVAGNATLHPVLRDVVADILARAASRPQG